MEEEEEENPSRNGNEASMEVAEAAPSAILLLLMSRVSQASGAVLPPLQSLVAPRRPEGAAAEHGEAAGAGPRPRAPLAKPFQKAEALLRHCLRPSSWRLFPPRPGGSAYDSEEEEEDLPAGLAHLARVERSFAGLSRCLHVQENPRTETFQGHVRQAGPDVARGAFTSHVARTSVARHCATLHALLQHRHHLRLCRHYGCCLKALSDFVRHLMTVRRCLLQPSGGQSGGWGHLLRGLCEEMRVHTAHWCRLQRRLRGDPWLRPLLLQRHELVQHMKRSLSLLVLHAARLLEGCVEALLRSVTRDTHIGAALLSDFFQGLEIYNQVVNDRALQQVFEELQGKPGAASHLQNLPGSSAAFPMERVLSIVAAERGRLAAQRLYSLLLRQQMGPGALGTVPSGGSTKPRPLEEALQAGEGTASLSVELQALCREEEEAFLLVSGQLVASTNSFWHHILNHPKQKQALPHLAPADVPDPAFAAAVSVLYVQYHPFLWKALTSSLGRQLELQSPLAGFQQSTGASLGQQLSRAVAQACLPQECAEEVMGLALRLLMRDTFQQWDQGFCSALGSSLTDRCLPWPARRTDEVCSQTAQILQDLFPPLAFSLRSLDSHPAAGLLVRTSLSLQLLSLTVATIHAACYWVMSKAYQYLASWSLSQFLLVSQGDLQLLAEETSRVSALVSAACPEGGRNQLALTFHQERELSCQVQSAATSIQLFSEDALKLFSADCKRMSAEIFSQTMPLGKHWRLPLRTELPASPSEYASAATQSVLGQVLQSVQLLPQDAWVPALSQVTAAFLEAWMDHILAQKIKFSLQGALQLKQDFDAVRELLRSEEYGLSPEIRQLVLSLPAFQQADSAVSCLLQQPSKSYLPSPTWEAFHTCCSSDGTRMQDGSPGSLNGVEGLEGLPAQARAVLENQLGDLLSHLQGPGCSPESYLSPMEQEWLALRLHGGRRWKGLALPCMKRTSEP